MRDSVSKTPKLTKKIAGGDGVVAAAASASAEKTSAKKLVQARLPFKIIASAATTPSVDAAVATNGKEDAIETKTKTTDTRKRKLSYDSDGVKSNEETEHEAAENSKENLTAKATPAAAAAAAPVAASKKPKTAKTSKADTSVVDNDGDDDDVVVVLGDDSDEEEQSKDVKKNSTKLSFKITTKRPKNRKSAGRKSTNATAVEGNNAKVVQDAKANGESSDDVEAIAVVEKNPPKTIKSATAVEDDVKNKQEKEPISKLPSNKRSTPARKSTTAAERNNEKSVEVGESSDDIEAIAVEQNPPKTLKSTAAVEDDKNKNNAAAASKKEPPISKLPLNKRRKPARKSTTATAEKVVEAAKDHGESSDDIEAIAVEQNPLKRPKVADNTENVEAEDKKKLPEKSEVIEIDLNSSQDNSEEMETSIVEAKDKSKEESVKTIPNDGTPKTLKTTGTGIDTKLTPKQQKLLEQRRKAREEKELKLQQEKEAKQQEKEERELAKKREREQREEQRRKEREEKEEQKRKEREEKDEQRRKEREEKDEVKRLEREEKERKRLAEQEAKNEEKRKKEQEKEDAELKKKRAAAVFSKFFVPKPATPRLSISGEQQQAEQENIETGKQLAFQPFQVKGDMKLAPVKRKSIDKAQRSQLERLIGYSGNNKNDDDGCVDSDDEDVVRRKPLPKAQLYLSQLANGKIKPGKWLRPVMQENPAIDDEVQIIDDDLERVGQAIVEENKRPMERLRAKYLKFHENRRPPYRGTWRKKTSLVSARRPFGKDTKYLDYEVDSDDEWEEEEPGESLDGSDEEKDKESEDEDYEVDNEWFVPHGHLSDEELQNDEEFDDGNTREAQKAKLQILQQEFAQEMRKETKKIKPRLIGCIWVDENGNQPEECPNIIWDTLNKRAMLCTGPISLEEPEIVESEIELTPPAEKIKPIVLTTDLLKQLVRLVHGNRHSKLFLITEYIAYLNAQVDAIKNGEALVPSKTALREKFDEYAEWKVVELENSSSNNGNNDSQNNGNGNGSNSTKKQKKPKKRPCWFVNDALRTQLELNELTINNIWSYILTPKFSCVEVIKESSANDAASNVSDDDETQPTATTNDEKSAAVAAATKVNKSTAAVKTATAGGGITKYTKVLTPEERKLIEEKAKSKKVANDVSSSPKTKSPVSKSTAKNSIKTPAQAAATTKTPTTQQPKKRVALLMSVPRGEQISQTTKNALISQFLKKDNNTVTATTTTTTKTNTPVTNTAASPVTVKKKTVIEPSVAEDDDDIIMLDD